jgi:hypothetical protein
MTDRTFPLDDGRVDVRWPAGRAFQAEAELLPAPARRRGGV